MSGEPSSVLSGYLTMEQLAEQLGLKLRTLQLWEARREGPPVTRLGKRPLYRREAVAAWLASRERPAVREGRQRRRLGGLQAEAR